MSLFNRQKESVSRVIEILQFAVKFQDRQRIPQGF